MNKYWVFLWVIMAMIACKNHPYPVSYKKFSLQEFEQKNTSIRAIWAVSQDTLYYAGSNGQVGYTYNAGKDWRRLSIVYQDSLKPEFRSIAGNGRAVFVLSAGNPALLYKIEKEHINLVYKESHPQVFYDAMAFFDPQTGIAMGDPTSGCLSVLRTTDGGEHWYKTDCKELPKTALGEAAFAASNSNLKIIDTSVWMVTGGSKARVFKSEDMGINWQVYDTPIIQGKPTQGIYSVDFYDKNNGIIFGGDYLKPAINTQNKAITRDGGKTWKLVADSQAPGYSSCVQYIPHSQGKKIMAVGKRGLSLSLDAGSDWKQLSDTGYYTIRFVNDSTAWLAGEEKVGLLQFTSGF